MNSINISQKAKNKHLNFSHYEFIINSLIQFNASHPGKRNIGKTQFIKELASTVGTTCQLIHYLVAVHHSLNAELQDRNALIIPDRNHHSSLNLILNGY